MSLLFSPFGKKSINFLPAIAIQTQKHLPCDISNLHSLVRIKQADMIIVMTNSPICNLLLPIRCKIISSYIFDKISISYLRIPVQILIRCSLFFFLIESKIVSISGSLITNCNQANNAHIKTALPSLALSLLLPEGILSLIEK